MKTTRLLLILVALLLVPVFAQGEQFGSLRIGYMEGDVQISDDETREWVAASVNMPLRTGDRIWVPDNGRVEIQSVDGSYIRLDRSTSLDVLRVENRGYQFSLNSGRAYVSFHEDRGDLIQVDTPLASVRLDKQARAKIDVYNGGDTDIALLKGTAVVEDRRGEVDVRQGELLALKENHEARVFTLPPPDEWERWNTQREKWLFERSASRQYLPDELRGYSHDFDEYGRWVDVPEYGRVWTPRTVINVSWAPYREGRWVWINGDYVWVSHEPWGWAPYHYGRWAHHPRHGWFWVPPRRGDVFWSPGYVAWVHTSNHVGWVPLAPGEIYYGRGNHGRHSVNVINNTVIINKTVNVYKNVSINHAVTTVHSQSFATGKYKYADVQKKTFGNEKVIAGAPRIAPTRESRMSNFKQIQADKQPPRMVQQAKPEQLKQERNFVRDRNRSVFKPDQKMERRPVQIQPAKPEQRDQRQVEKQRIQAPADRQLPVKQPERQEKMNGKERERVKDQPLPSRDRRDDSLTPRDTRPGIRGQQDGDKAKSGQIAPAGPPPPQRQPDITERRKRTPEAAPPPVERRAPQQSVTPAKPDVRDSQRIERAGDTRDKGPGTGKEAPPRQQELKKQEERRKTIPEVAPAPVERRAPQQAVTPAKQEQRPSPGPQNIQRREPAGEPKGREKAVERGAGPAPEKSRKVESEQKQQQDKDESPNRPDRSDGRERERPRR